MSFNSNDATRKREAKEARDRQMQAELERRERVRQAWSYNLKDARAQEVREIESAKAEYQNQFQTYYRAMRESVLVSPDPDGFFNSAPALDCDASVEVQIHWDNFLRANTEFYNSENNRESLSRYFGANNCYRPDSVVYEAAYKRLLSLGLLETYESKAEPYYVAPEPAPAPQFAGTPIRHDEDGPIFSVRDYNFDSRFAKQDDRIEGRNPENGYAWICSKLECDRMTSEDWKRFASITKASQTLTGMRSDYGDRYTG